jgi:hypothetical protein
MSASIALGQATKPIFAYATLTGWFFSAVFCVLAAIFALKAYAAR